MLSMLNKLRTAKIRGLGPFPIEMLRYDSCWPMTEADSALVSRTFECRTEPWEIMVTGHIVWRTGWTVERWRSFLVVCEPGEVKG